MAFTVYKLEQSDQWDTVVRSFNNYDVYWLSGYVKGFQIHGDGEPLLFFYKGKDSNTRGINVVMKRDVAKDEHFKGKIDAGQYFDFATPYGYGGWLIEGNNTEELFAAYNDWLEKNGIICEFVRFHPMLENHEQSAFFYDVVQLGEVVHIDLSSPETVWHNLISQNRNKIRKAIKNGVKIYSGRYPEIFEKFIEIYNKTMNHDKAISYYYFKPEFYKSILEDLSENAQIFYAVKDDVIIATAIMLTTRTLINYHLSGSLKDYKSLAPVNLLLYETALWGCANGYKTLYLGGGVGSGEDSLFTFKRGFNRGKLNHFYIGKKIYDQARYTELLQIRKASGGEIMSNFFPLYRAITPIGANLGRKIGDFKA